MGAGCCSGVVEGKTASAAPAALAAGSEPPIRVVLPVAAACWHSLSGASAVCFTLPTETPPIRTSASFCRVIASGKSAVKR